MKDTLANSRNIEQETSEIVDVKMSFYERDIIIEWADIISEISNHLFNSLIPHKDKDSKEITEEIKKLLNIFMVMFSRLGPASDYELNYAWIENIEFFCLNNEEFMPYFKVFI